jgi:hypothetical protein
MLPFPIFLFLLISATLLAPPPPGLVGSFKISTLRSFEWSSLYTSIPDPDLQSPPEDTALFSLGMPLVTPNPLPTQCCPNSMLVANNTVPHSFVRATDGRTSCTAVLLVVSLAMLNYFVCFSLALCLFSELWVRYTGCWLMSPTNLTIQRESWSSSRYAYCRRLRL